MNTLVALMMSDADQAKLGAVYLVVFMLMVIVGLATVLKFAPRYMARRRDKEIERAMRMGVRDAEAQARIAQKIADEYQQGQ
jgi:hypothetical protein